MFGLSRQNAGCFDYAPATTGASLNMTILFFENSTLTLSAASAPHRLMWGERYSTQSSSATLLPSIAPIP